MWRGGRGAVLLREGVRGADLLRPLWQVRPAMEPFARSQSPLPAPASQPGRARCSRSPLPTVRRLIVTSHAARSGPHAGRPRRARAARQAAWLEHAGVHDATPADTTASLAALRARYADFLRQLRAAGWDPADVVLRAGGPRLRLEPSAGAEG